MTSFGVLGYSLAALAFGVLAVLLGVSWGGRREGAYLIAASVVTAIWGCLLAAVAHGEAPILLIFFAEMLRDASWLLALSVLAKIVAPSGLVLAARAAAAIALVSSFVIPFLASRAIIFTDPLVLLSRSGLIAALIGLVLLEQIYRNGTEASRSSLRHFVIGVGVLFAYDLFLYSQAELLRGVTAEAWYARGFVNVLAVPLIAVAVRRLPQWSLDVFVSRHVVFYTATFMGAGVYLVLMSLGGYYVREFGGEWGRLGQILFFAGAAVVLGFLVGSSALRRHARVFLSKHFYRNKYDYRIEWLRFISTLSSAPGAGVAATAVRAIAQIFASPGGVLFRLDEAGGRFTPAAAWPMQLDDAPGLADVRFDAELARFIQRTHWIIDLEEYRRRPEVYDNVAVPDWILELREARILAPLLQLDRVVGFIMLYDPPPPFELTYEDRDLLKTVGRHVATHLAQHEADRRLAELGQFEAYNRLTAFLMHDLKNSVAQLKLVVQNAGRHKHNPEFIEDAIGTIANTVERMTRLIEQLSSKSTAERQAEVDLGTLAREAAQRCSDRKPRPSVEARRGVAVGADPERLTAVIEHLIRNAQDATSDDGAISISVDAVGDRAILTVVDTGSGMTQDFVRERLFRPFDSTKGAKGMGIGAYQVREYVRTLGGLVEVQSSPGSGTVFSITLPLIPRASAADASLMPERAVS